MDLAKIYTISYLNIKDITKKKVILFHPDAMFEKLSLRRTLLPFRRKDSSARSGGS